MSPKTPDPALSAVAEALVRLVPRADGIDRDQLLFRAGQASARRRHWPWPAAAAVSTLAAAALGLVLLLRPEPQPVERLVVVRVVEPPTPSPQPEPLPPGSLTVLEEEPPPAHAEYLNLRRQVIRWGADALPSAPPAAAQGAYAPRSGIDDLLERPGWLRRPLSPRSGDSL